MTAQGSRRVELWLVDARDGGLKLRRGGELPGAGRILGAVVAGERFMVLVSEDPSEPDASAFVVDLAPADGPRVVAREGLAPLAALNTDDERAFAVLAAVGPSRVVVALEQFVYLLDLDPEGRARVTRREVGLDESCKPQSAHALAGGGLVLSFARRHHPMVNSPSRLQVVVLRPDPGAPGGVAVELRSPDVTVVRPVEMMASAPWCRRGDLLWSMAGPRLFAMEADGDGAVRFRAELRGEDVKARPVDVGAPSSSSAATGASWAATWIP